MKGLEYFVGELAKNKRYKAFITKFYDENGKEYWGVMGNTEDKVRMLTKAVIDAAVEKEIAESKRVYDDSYNGNGRGYAELKAKEEAGYNAAWLYECTYKKQYGSDPKRMIHKAYQKPKPESYEYREGEK